MNSVGPVSIRRCTALVPPLAEEIGLEGAWPLGTILVQALATQRQHSCDVNATATITNKLFGKTLQRILNITEILVQSYQLRFMS
jgi:hypothetical protein